MENKGNYQEVLARLEGLKELITSKFEGNDQDHTRIIGRMDVANGRTNKCEDKIGVLENWRWYIIGIGCVIVFIIDFLVQKI